jgi:hypothetical protein
METENEWKFINITIIDRNLTVKNDYDEWWIGLVKRDGEWKWLSNHTRTYYKWQPHEPSNDSDETYAIIARNYPNNTYGLLNNVRITAKKGRICEYQKEGKIILYNS